MSPTVPSTLVRTVSFCLHLYHYRADLYILLTGPAQLKGPFDSTGFPVGCKSACLAGLGDPGQRIFPIDPGGGLSS